MKMTAQAHVRIIEEWVQDIVNEYRGTPYEVDESEAYSDTVVAYLASEIGSSSAEDKQMIRDICRLTGVSPSRVDWR